MDYTCDNCKYRHTWDCDDGYATRKCEDFELDMATISEKETALIRVLQHAMKTKEAKIHIGIK